MKPSKKRTERSSSRIPGKIDSRAKTEVSQKGSFGWGVDNSREPH